MKKTAKKNVALVVLLLTALVAVGVLLIQVAGRIFAGDQSATALRQIVVLVLACGLVAYGIGTALFWWAWHLCGTARPGVHFIEMDEKESGQLWSMVWFASCVGLLVGLDQAFSGHPWQIAARCVLEAVPLYYAGWRMYYAGWRGAETAPKLTCTHQEVGHGH